jgi:hypothetical protein
MSDSELRLAQLQQIPVFALQEVLAEFFLQSQELKEELSMRFHEVLGIRPKILESAIKKLTRDQLNRLIAACPEITATRIRELFEQYRYGINPSFHIYRHNGAKPTISNNLDELKARFRCEFAERIEDADEHLPTVKSLVLNSLDVVAEYPSILEGNYRFLKRLSYINEEQDAVSTYETSYGFFWINFAAGYVIIHSQKESILKAIRRSVEAATEMQLFSLQIPKELQKELTFLSPETMRVARLDSPNPNSNEFSSVTYRDENLHEKGFTNIADKYQEAPRTHYRETVEEDKQTTLVVFEKGSFTIYGKFTATQFRRWCISRMDEIMEVLTEFISDGEKYLSTLNLKQTREFRRLRSSKEKEFFLEIVKAFMLLKNQSVGHYELSATPLEFAAAFSNLVHVQIRFSCSDDTCDEEGYLSCLTCGSRGLRIRMKNGSWNVECCHHRNTIWGFELPLVGACERLHPFAYDFDDIESRIEIFIGPKLQQLLQDVCSTYLDDYFIDFDKETIYVSGRYFRYHRSKIEVVPGNSPIQNVFVAGNNVMAENIVGNKGVAFGFDNTAKSDN